MVSVVAALAEDLVEEIEGRGGPPRSVLLWLDPDGQFTRLRTALEGELAARDVTLIALEPGGSQLDAKLTILDVEAAGAKAVVHLPRHTLADLDATRDGRPPPLWAMVEYRYKGAIWGGSAGGSERPPSLDSWLTSHGIRFSGGGARASVTAGGADSRLARYAARRAFSDLGQFPQPVNQQTLNIAGDPRDLAIDLLLDPAGAVARWGDDARDAQHLVESTFGLTFDGDAPAAWANQLAMHLALVDAWEALGQGSDFPFAQRIPTTESARSAVLKLVRRSILPRPDVAARLRSLIAHHTTDLSGLVAWAVPRAGTPATIPAIIERRVGDLLDAIDGAPTTANAVDALDATLGPPSAGLDPRLDILHTIVALARRAAEEQTALLASPDAAALQARYAKRSWVVDATFLDVMAACRDHASMVSARRLAERLYATYLDAVNQRFTDVVEAGEVWPPAEVRSVRDDAADIWQKPAKPRERRGIIVVDALRLDLARRLVTELGETSELGAVASTLPTTTPFGMTALLPIGQGPIGVVTGKSTVQLLNEDSDSLEERIGRKALLQRLVEGRGDTIAFTEVELLLQGEPVPSARYVVAFTYALDDRGHSVADTASLPEVAAQLPGRLARVIRRLHAAGIQRVDVVTDHGFLWLPPTETDALGTPAVSSAQVRKKAARYAILADGAAAPELMHLPLPFDPSVTVGFPRGIRTLSKATWYLHGGVSLQESIIPHVISHAAEPPPRLAVSISVPVREIAGATIPARLAPDVRGADGQLSLGGPTPVRIRLAATAIIDGKPVMAAEPTIVEVRSDSPELGSALYLHEGLALPAGTVISVTAHDEVTQEQLLEHSVTLLTDWE